MIDMAQADRTLRQGLYKPEFIFYVVDIRRDKPLFTCHTRHAAFQWIDSNLPEFWESEYYMLDKQVYK